MSIESEIFLKMSPLPDRLAAFGFSRESGDFVFTDVLRGGEFEAAVRVGMDGSVTGQVTDTSTGEEYIPIRIESHEGAFVRSVREEYAALLRRIADSCFEKRVFVSSQGCEISRRIFEKYGEEPDFPFSSDDAGVFRYPPNRRWYAIIMYVKKRSVLRTGPGVDGDAEMTEVMNVRTGEENTGSVRLIPGIYPAYHMDRKNWVSIILDGTVPDSTVMELLDRSRDFAVCRGSGRKKQHPEGHIR